MFNFLIFCLFFLIFLKILAFGVKATIVLILLFIAGSLLMTILGFSLMWIIAIMIVVGFLKLIL